MQSPQDPSSGIIETLLHEERRYAPSPEFVAQANINDPSVYERAEQDPLGFWMEAAGRISWFKQPTRTLDWNPPFARWFEDGVLNASYNCLDRQLEQRGDKAAIIWEGEPGEVRTFTYRELHREVNRAAHMLRDLGIHKGDRVAIYMPMIPEVVIAMLACARLGAPHTVVFGGFSPESLRDRIVDAHAKLVITADGGYRRGGIVPLKQNTDAALDAPDLPVEKVLVVHRVVEGIHGLTMQEGRDVWWHDALASVPEDAAVEPEPVEAEHPLFILYTSGTTGKPKGVLHTTGGYMVGTNLTTNWVFDLKENDIYWCTADVGWVTGHSYLVYGPLSNGATAVMYEGTPDFPDKDRWWRIIERHRVTILYTAPTAIRSFMRWGTEFPERCDLSSLRLLGTVGEPINPEAWVWYHQNIGASRCPVVDTWWQTETGAIMITPLPGLVPTKPGSATRPFPGIAAQIVDEDGNPVEKGVTGGLLVIKRPWPSMLRTIWGDDERYKQQYWGKFDDGYNTYFTGDGANQDADGYFWLMGRVDDVLNVAGHRLGTMELESALVSHPSVAEAAVVGVSHEVKGQGVVAFVTPRSGVHAGPELVDILRNHVAERIGAIAKPDRIYFTSELPKTRSAKIMRRLLRDIAEGRVLGDTTTLADPNVMASIKKQYEENE
ncbi:MAG TPA: acetate--CoA ligase [Chloroflexia bacterium]|nr:acetate--CoA ligase [Chloroflexia bacterium]